MSLSLYEKVKLFTPLPYIANSREQKAAVKIRNSLKRGGDDAKLTSEVIDGYLMGKGDNKEKAKKLAIVAAKVNFARFDEALLKKVSGSIPSEDFEEGIRRAADHYESKTAIRKWAWGTAVLMGAGCFPAVFLCPHVLAATVPGFVCGLFALARTDKKTMRQRGDALRLFAEKAANTYVGTRQVLRGEDGVPLRFANAIAVKKPDGTTFLYNLRRGGPHCLAAEFDPGATVPDVLDRFGRQIRPTSVDEAKFAILAGPGVVKELL